MAFRRSGVRLPPGPPIFEFGSATGAIRFSTLIRPYGKSISPKRPITLQFEAMSPIETSPHEAVGGAGTPSRLRRGLRAADGDQTDRLGRDRQSCDVVTVKIESVYEVDNVAR